MFGGTKVSGILKIYKSARRFFGVCSGLCSREPTSALADTDDVFVGSREQTGGIVAAWRVKTG